MVHASVSCLVPSLLTPCCHVVNSSLAFYKTSNQRTGRLDYRAASYHASLLQPGLPNLLGFLPTLCHPKTLINININHNIAYHTLSP